MVKTDIKLCIALGALGAAVSVYADKQAEDAPPPLPTLHVQVNDAVVRSAPSFLSEVASTLSYGDTVGIVEDTEDWHKVQPEATDLTGWMHVSALTEKTIKLEAGENDENVKASKQELAAGGRGGFTQEVEDTFRNSHEELEASYLRLDQLTSDPSRHTSRNEVLRFMREGQLQGQGGVQ